MHIFSGFLCLHLYLRSVVVAGGVVVFVDSFFCVLLSRFFFSFSLFALLARHSLSRFFGIFQFHSIYLIWQCLCSLLSLSFAENIISIYTKNTVIMCAIAICSRFFGPYTHPLYALLPLSVFCFHLYSCDPFLFQLFFLFVTSLVVVVMVVVLLFLLLLHCTQTIRDKFRRFKRRLSQPYVTFSMMYNTFIKCNTTQSQ